MDLEDIGSKISQLTMYDVRRAYTGALNWALNVSEMEAKVKEATSDEKWGASSTQMQEIAQATNNFADFNEIMPAIYRNFMEREAREWRMIYKALQLLEYLVKHGSERVVDDARSHLGTIKILRNFHYIDEAGKDQGINVRTRSKELSTLLGDVEAIRQERRKARANRQKYTQGGGAGDFIPGSGTGRYGGFGSDSAFASGLGAGGYGGSSAGGSGGGGYGGDRAEEFDEYDAGDAEERTAKPKPAPRSSTTRAAARAPEAPAKPAPVVQDLFSFDDDDEQQMPAAVAAPAAAPARAPAAAKPTASLDFDDFDDFQAAPAPAAAAPAAPLAASRPAPASTPSYSGSAVMAPTRASAAPAAKPAAPASGASSGAFGFDDLWAASSGTAASGAAAQKGKGKMSLAEMARDKSSNAVWGSNAPAQAPPQQQAQKKPDLFDLL